MELEVKKLIYDLDQAAELAHGYDVISDEIVWDIVQNKLPGLRQEIAEIKQDFGIA